MLHKNSDIFRKTDLHDEFIDMLKKRRSYKLEFDSREINKDVIIEAIEIARWAPSAHNSQTWRYIILDKNKKRIELINKMNEKLKKDLNLTYLFITHDLATARYICDRLAVIFQGELVEVGPTEKVINDPKHPYTKMLLSAVPVPDPKLKRKRIEVAERALIEHSAGCVSCKFYERCPI